MPMLNNLLSKLRQKPYRDAYVKAHVSQGLAYQITALRQQRGWSQQDLAEKLSLKSQSAVARMEDPGYGKLSIATLLKLASVFDVALSIRFQPYSRFVRERQDVSAAALEVKPFDQDVRSYAWVHQLPKEILSNQSIYSIPCGYSELKLPQAEINQRFPNVTDPHGPSPMDSKEQPIIITTHQVPR